MHCTEYLVQEYDTDITETHNFRLKNFPYVELFLEIKPHFSDHLPITLLSYLFLRDKSLVCKVQSTPFLVLDPEEGDITHLRNVGNYLPLDMVTSNKT